MSFIPVACLLLIHLRELDFISVNSLEVFVYDMLTKPQIAYKCRSHRLLYSVHITGKSVMEIKKVIKGKVA